MSNQEKIIKNKLGVLKLAEMLGSVSQASVPDKSLQKAKKKGFHGI